MGDKGTRYEGTWVHNMKDGEGEEAGVDGGTYRGTFTQGVRHGKGSWAGASVGDAYTGDWAEGQWHGFGRATWADESFFDGEWVYGKRCVCVDELNASGVGEMIVRWDSNGRRCTRKSACMVELNESTGEGMICEISSFLVAEGPKYARAHTHALITHTTTTSHLTGTGTATVLTQARASSTAASGRAAVSPRAPLASSSAHPPPLPLAATTTTTRRPKLRRRRRKSTTRR
jgi:hypothetical protein